LKVSTIDQKRGVITLIPKKGKNKLLIKNWRPITLLNTDYKILAKLLALRIETVMPFIICDDQTGYIKGRFIGQNIRIIEDTIIIANENNIPGIILTIDFEKAFDSISWSFIEKALYAYNFGVNYIKWIFTTKSKVQ